MVWEPFGPIGMRSMRDGALSVLNRAFASPTERQVQTRCFCLLFFRHLQDLCCVFWDKTFLLQEKCMIPGACGVQFVS